MKVVLCVALLCGTLGLPVFAQNDPTLFPCATLPDNAWADWYHANKHRWAQERAADTTWLTVPVTLHLTSTNDGAGQYGVGAALADLCQMNDQFVPARIRFYLQPDDFLRTYKNSDWHSHDYAKGGEMIQQTRLPDRFNIYVVSGASGACGYSWRDVIVNAKSCSGPRNTTWVHEAGHHLSLPHTFRGWESQSYTGNKRAPSTVSSIAVERVDESNCAQAGDRFCDTDPDYLSNRWRCDAQGRSIQRQFDPDSTAFSSDGTLYMSYALDACTNRFSPEQIAAMRTNLRTEHAVYGQREMPVSALDPNASVALVSPVDSQRVQFNGFTLQWRPVAGARFYVVRVAWDTRFATLFVNDLVRDTSLFVARPIPNNRLLYWQVQAYDEVNLCAGGPPQVGVFQTRNLETVSTNALADLLDVQWSPNPVPAGETGQLTVQSPESFAAELRLCDVTGKLYQRSRVHVAAGETPLAVETGSLPQGVYFLTLENALGRVVRRLVVQPY